MRVSQVYTSFVLTDPSRSLLMEADPRLADCCAKGMTLGLSILFLFSLVNWQPQFLLGYHRAGSLRCTGCCEKIQTLFLGSKVIIHSDHNPLTYLTESASKSSKLMRWSSVLAQFDVEFQFRARKMNVPADTLSRPGSGAFDQSEVCK